LLACCCISFPFLGNAAQYTNQKPFLTSYSRPPTPPPPLAPATHTTPRPPRNDVIGLSVAAAVIGTWALLFWHALWGITLGGPQQSPWWDIAGTFFALEFASAGLFITTHGAARAALFCVCMGGGGG
jgi:hypothetical protein